MPAADMGKHKIVSTLVSKLLSVNQCFEVIERQDNKIFIASNLDSSPQFIEVSENISDYSFTYSEKLLFKSVYILMLMLYKKMDQNK